MNSKRMIMPAFALGLGLLFTGCSDAGERRSRSMDPNTPNTTGTTAEHTGAVDGTGDVRHDPARPPADAGMGDPTISRGRSGIGGATGVAGAQGKDTGLSRESGSTTGGGTSPLGSDRGNHPNKRDQR